MRPHLTQVGYGVTEIEVGKEADSDGDRTHRKQWKAPEGDHLSRADNLLKNTRVAGLDDDREAVQHRILGLPVASPRRQVEKLSLAPS